MDNFLFNLKKPVQYNKKGKLTEAFQLELLPPSMQNFKEVSILSQLVTSAIMDARKFAEEKEEKEEVVNEEDKKIDKDAIKMLVLSSNCDIEKLANTFKKYCYTNCIIDNEVHITEVHFNSLEISDFFDLMFSFIENFIMPSCLPQV